MMLYQVFTFVYVLNYFQFEGGMIHTWDIISERFGWNLIWGDYVLVPYFYCIAGWWLVDASGPPLSPVRRRRDHRAVRLRILALSRRQRPKHRFKRDPNTRIWGKPAESLDGRLLVSDSGASGGI